MDNQLWSLFVILTGLWLSEKFEGTGYKAGSGLRAMMHWIQATSKKQAVIIQAKLFVIQTFEIIVLAYA